MDIKIVSISAYWFIPPMHQLPGGWKIGQFESVSTVKKCPTLYDGFMLKSVSKCSLFTYILDHFQKNWH